MKIRFCILDDNNDNIFKVIFSKMKSENELVYHLQENKQDKIYIYDLDGFLLNTYSFTVPSPYQRHIDEFKSIYSKLDFSLLKTSALMCDSLYIDIELDKLEIYYK